MANRFRPSDDPEKRAFLWRCVAELRQARADACASFEGWLREQKRANRAWSCAWIWEARIPA